MIKSEIKKNFETRMLDKLVSLYSTKDIVKALSFKDCLRLAYFLMYNERWDSCLQEYAVLLLYEIQTFFQEEWNSSWEYDALLGLACYLVCKYDERYEAYNSAFKKTNKPPPSLLIELARCCICPGTPPISYDDAIALVKKAIEKTPYTDGIGLLSHIYALKDDKENEEYWTNILKKSKPEFISPSIEPKFLVEEYLQEKNAKQPKTL